MSESRSESSVDFPETTSPKPFAFVLMPFAAEFNDVYELGIKEACAAAGMFSERVDQQIFFGNILERVYNQIAKADVVIADVSGRNANVFYEVGYAHALNKRVVLLTKEADDIPFDLKQYPHIVYGGQIASILRPNLETTLRWCVEHPHESILNAEFPLELYIGQDRVKDFPDQIASTPVNTEKRAVFCKISLHNPTRRFYRGDATAWLITPAFLDKNDLGSKTILLPGERVMHFLGTVPNVPPEGWEGYEFNLLSKQSLKEDRVVDLTVRVFTELGPRDQSFKLQI